MPVNQKENQKEINNKKMLDFNDGKTEDIISLILPKEPDEKRIEKLERRIKLLEKRTTELEKKK